MAEERIVNFYQNKTAKVNDAFDRVVAEIHIRKQKDGFRSFMLCGCEPGVGSTTLAISLAVSMANSGWKTLLIDGDMRKAVNHKCRGEEASNGLAEYLVDAASFEEVLTKTNYENLTYVSSGSPMESAVSMLCSSRMKDFLDEAAREYDYVIIDMPSLASAVDASILASLIDATVLVTKQGTGKKEFIRAAKEKLDKAGANILGIIVNKVEKTEYKKAIRDYDYFTKQRYIKLKKNKKKA